MDRLVSRKKTRRLKSMGDYGSGASVSSLKG